MGLWHDVETAEIGSFRMRRIFSFLPRMTMDTKEHIRLCFVYVIEQFDFDLTGYDTYWAERFVFADSIECAKFLSILENRRKVEKTIWV